MEKEIMLKDIAKIRNKWFNTKEDELDMALNIISDLETQLKKQQKINQKAIEFIKGIDFNYLEETYQISTKEYLETILEILEDKEV